MRSYCLLVVLAALLIAIPAASAPPRPPQRDFSRHAPAREAAVRMALDLEGACGTPHGSAAGMVARHLERGPLEPQATPNSTDIGEIAVLEDDGTFFFDLFADGTRKSLDVAAATRAFYRTHGDDYGGIAFYCASGINTWLGSPTALAAAFVVRNDIQGIGLDAFDYGLEFGSPTRLQNALIMNGLHRYVNDPDSAIGIDQFTPLDLLAHEFGHRWLSYVWVDSAGTPSSALLGRSRQHWSFLADVDASIMEGCSWARIEPDSFLTDSVTTGYGGLDLYLMGLASETETDSVLTVYDGTSWNPPGTYGKVAYPQPGVGCRGRAYYWKVDDVERLNGARVPDAATAPKNFGLAFVLIVPQGASATPADLQKLENLRTAFVPYFAYATRGKGTIDVSLDSHAGKVAIAHTPLNDTEDTMSPRPVGARITIDPGGIPIALDASSARLHWRQNGGAWSMTPLSPAGPDSFAATLPAPGASAAIEYYFYASSDSAGIEAFEPPAAAAAPYAYQAGPDAEPPSIVHVPVRVQGNVRLPQQLLARVTDNTGLDSVWAEYHVNGGPLQSAAVTTAGRDSFKVSLGGGLAIGQWVAYRFVARDASTATNVAWSNAGFDTLRAQRDWLFDLENGADGMTTDGVSGVYRKLWHFSETWSSPAGGTAWKFGSRDSLPYPPHSGGYLYLPSIPPLEPGVKLRFDHRYGFEQADETYAWDGAYLEARGPVGDWQVIEPASGYSHEFLTNMFGLRGKPCWSGKSSGWKAEVFDLTPFAPNFLFLRFLVFADDFMGDEGWWLDHFRLEYPNGVVTGVTPGAGVELASAWPNPARGELRQRISVSAAAEVEWALFDLQGRRVAALWKGRVPAGGQELRALIPSGVRAGLYFTRVSVDGRVARNDRVAVIR